MFTVIGNPGGRACQNADTIPPIAPVARFFFPDDTGRSVVPASDSTLRVYRTLMRVTFYDTTGGDQVRAAIARWGGAIVAGGPYPNAYIVRLPDPGSTWGAYDSLQARLMEEPSVQDVFPLAIWDLP
jgi:hypothetical protein